MHTADILNYDRNSKDPFEFELQQCSCQDQGTDLLFAGSFDPDEIDVSTTNLTVNLRVMDSNTSETSFSLSNQIVQMTNTLNIFKYNFSLSEVNPVDLRTRNVSIFITIDGGIIPSSLV